jgi:arginyl-tRNA synthetase
VVAEGEERYARPDIGHGERVQVEFISANPTGPIHVGNGWWGSYGDALARVLARSGYQVSREYYVNDTGGQIRRLGESLLARRAGTDVPDEGYQGAYVTELAAAYDGPDDVTTAGRWAATRILDNIRATLESIGIAFDEWYSQASIEESGAVDETIELLRVLVRGFDRVIDVFGADHHGQVASLIGGVEALGVAPGRLEVKLGQMVSLIDGDETARMSKRAGNFVSLSSLIDDIGPDATRLLSLMSSLDQSTSLDLPAVRAQSMENPVFYVQYATARIAAIGRKAAERGISRAPIDTVGLSVLTDARELELLRCLEELPEVVAEASVDRAPTKVTAWVRRLAGCFHGFYHDCPVLSDDVDPALTQARLWLVEATRIGLAIGLDLLGVSAPEAM